MSLSDGSQSKRCNEQREAAPVAGALQLWAGPECTVNRVGDVYRDQLEECGFAQRLGDMDRLATLGIARMRFPLLWERTAPHEPNQLDWRYADERLSRLHDLGIAPIAGLLHHGSGPRYTHLLAAEFPAKLADYARAVAERFPHIDAYTPVNEPLTTARFSALYGFWYPHHRCDPSFVRALLNQVRGTVLAMRSIRKVNVHAQLVQTEDLGFTTSVPLLGYQARFENARRWLSFDLLCGKVDRAHAMWRYLVRHGASVSELQALVDQPCPPDVMGINSYVTSERFLDDRLADYPREKRGGNGRHRYADVETVRVRGQVIGSFLARLRETHHRYNRPMALTEVHMSCTRDEQLRWLNQAWRDAQTARAEGLDVRAVTAWAAFGAYDWNSLITRNAGHYEPGIWDVRSGATPRETALAPLARQVAAGQAPSHPALDGIPWWLREERLLYPSERPVAASDYVGRTLLIAGATGTLGQAFGHQCAERGLPHRLLSRSQLDITNAASIEAAIQAWKPWAIVNAAGYVRVDDAEHDGRQWLENAIGPALLAQGCARNGVRLMGFSSDLVFGGEKCEPYVERDALQPLNAYGRSKAEAEQRMLEYAPNALMIRTSAFFGPWDAHNFLTQGLAVLSRGEHWLVPDDQVVSPTYVPDLVTASLDLLIDGEVGLWHLANRGAVSWVDFARLAARAAKKKRGLVVGRPGAELGQRAPRPRYAALGSERATLMPTLGDAITRYLDHKKRSKTLSVGN